MPKISLDKNERRLLEAYREADPDGQYWTAPWALYVAFPDFDAVAVARRLCARKLLEGAPGVRGKWRGYIITDKGRGALA